MESKHKLCIPNLVEQLKGNHGKDYTADAGLQQDRLCIYIKYTGKCYKHAAHIHSTPLCSSQKSLPRQTRRKSAFSSQFWGQISCISSVFVLFLPRNLSVYMSVCECLFIRPPSVLPSSKPQVWTWAFSKQIPFAFFSTRHRFTVAGIYERLFFPPLFSSFLFFSNKTVT